MAYAWPLRETIDSDGLLPVDQVFDGGGGVAHGLEVAGHVLLGHGGDLRAPEEGLCLLRLEELFEIVQLSLRLAIGVGEDGAVGETLDV